MSSDNSQIPFPIGTPDFAIQRPSDQVWLHFETYCEDYGASSDEDDPKMWGFNLWMADGHREFEMSEASFASEADVKRWLIANIDEWRYVSSMGWCFPDMEYRLPQTETAARLKF